MYCRLCSALTQLIPGPVNRSKLVICWITLWLLNTHKGHRTPTDRCLAFTGTWYAAYTHTESLNMLLLYIYYLPGNHAWNLELPLDTVVVSGYYMPPFSGLQTTLTAQENKTINL